MDLLGFTLNGVTLLALSLVAGVLVDDAIVEIENIVRHMRMGKSAYQASIDAADEIGLPVVATTFSIVAVFLPVGLMPASSGKFFKSFGLTIVVTVLISLAVARLITPMIAAYFLKAKGQAKHGEGWLMDRYMACSAGRCATAGRRSDRRPRLRRDHLRLRDPALHLPADDEDTVQVAVEMPPGVTLDQTRAVADPGAGDRARGPMSLNRVRASVRVGNAATIYIS
jgi:multidrug efflux pump subunit AcrB